MAKIEHNTAPALSENLSLLGFVEFGMDKLVYKAQTSCKVYFAASKRVLRLVIKRFLLIFRKILRS